MCSACLISCCKRKMAWSVFPSQKILLHYPELDIIETICSNQHNHFYVFSVTLDFRHCKLKSVSCFTRGPRECWKAAIQYCCHISCGTDANCQEGEHGMGNSTLTDKCDRSRRMSFCSLKSKEIHEVESKWEIHKESNKKALMDSLRQTYSQGKKAPTLRRQTDGKSTQRMQIIASHGKRENANFDHCWPWSVQWWVAWKENSLLA